MERVILASASPRRKELLGQLGLEFEICPAKGEEIITKTEPEEVVKELAFQKAAEIAWRIRSESEAKKEMGCEQSEYKANKDTGREQGKSEDKPVKIIGADTIVVYKNQIFGKPADEADAERMLTLLQGNTHQVYTGVCVITLFPGKEKRDEAQCGETRQSVDTAGKADVCFGDNIKNDCENDILKCTQFVEKTDVTMYPVSVQEIQDYIATGECMDKAGAYAIQGISAKFIREIHGDYNNVVGLPMARLWQECFKNQEY